MSLGKIQQAGKLTQLVFCDISTPKASTAAQKDKMAMAAGSRTAGGADLHALDNLLDVTPDAPFSVYDDIRDKLIAKGIPASQDSVSKQALSKAHAGLNPEFVRKFADGIASIHARDEDVCCCGRQTRQVIFFIVKEAIIQKS